MVLQTLVLFSSLLTMALYSYESAGLGISSSSRCSQTDVQNSKLIPCSHIAVNSSVCVSQLGCCWNDSIDSNTTTQCFNISTTVLPTRFPVATTHAQRSTRPTSLSNKRDGFCIVYDRPACTKWLNKTASDEGSTPRFIDERLGINKTDYIIFQFLEVINKNVDKEQEECKNLLRVILCQFTLPVCDEYGVPKNPCREDCDAIFKKCDKPLTQLLAVAKYIIDHLGISFVHVGIPNCTQHKYSHEMAVNETCEHFGLFDFEKTSEPQANTTIWPLVAGIGGPVIIILSILIVSLVVRTRTIREKCALNGATFTTVTMRDRLRADTMLALDKTKLLSLYNPDKMVQFPLDRVEYVKDLGEGNFGQVFQGRCFGLRPTGEPEKKMMVAVKTLKAGCSKEIKRAFLQEVTLMSVLHHENIVELLAVSTEEEPYGMIFEFVANGDLNQYLRKQSSYGMSENESKDKGEILTRADLLSIALQVANGMEWLQGMRFVHRDLATRNCLVGDGLTIKIADFGMSRDVYASDYYKVEGQAVMPIRWMPPEALLYGKFTVESDIYSYGVLLWEVYTYALQPYYGYTNEEVLEFIKNGVHLGMPDDCEPHIYDVMQRCWKRDSLQRPNYETIKALLRNDECHYNIASKTLGQNPLENSFYTNTVFAGQETNSKQISPAKVHKIKKEPCTPISTGYMNVDSKDGKTHRNGKLQLEEGDQEI